MEGLTFAPAKREHAKGIEQMRNASAYHLTDVLGGGHWSGLSRIQSIRERIDCGDPESIARMTLFVAIHDQHIVGSVAVSPASPGFWRRSFWREPTARGLGVFNLVVHPSEQRRGVGTFLMRQVERLADEHGFDYVRLDAYAQNPISTSFYRSIGYDERLTIEVRTVALVLFEKCLTSGAAIAKRD